MSMNPNEPIDLDRKKKQKGMTRAVVLVAVLLLAAVVSITSFVTISEGYIGVKYRFGKIVADNLQPGLNFKIPVIENVVRVDVREQIYEADTNAYTKDTQTVENLRFKLNYYYDQSKLSELIRNVGINNVESKLVIPQVLSITKNEIGQFKAEELIQNRTVVQENIEQKVSDSLALNGIVVASFALEDVDFEDGFEEAVRAKVVAEQDALKMQNKTKEAEEKARQTVISAQAQADSQRIEAEAQAYSIQVVQEQLVNSPQYIEYEKIQKWNGQFPQAMGENINPFVALDGSTSSQRSSTTAPSYSSNEPEE